MKTTTIAWQCLPEQVTPNCYRFFCTFLRHNLFDNTIILDVDGQECALPVSQVTVGLVDGKLCCDIKERVAINLKLV